MESFVKPNLEDTKSADKDSEQFYDAVDAASNTPHNHFFVKWAKENKNQKDMSMKDPDEDLVEQAKDACQKNKNAIKIKFTNICYSVDVKSNKAQLAQGEPKVRNLDILKNCSGVAFPGQTLFIMGASGAGKTSLLNSLADRIVKDNSKRFSGEILINDTKVMDQDTYGKFGAYVM